MFAGSLAMSALNLKSVPAKEQMRCAMLLTVAGAFVCASLFLVGRKWPQKGFILRLALFLFCFYAAMATGAWAGNLIGRTEPTPSQLVIATLSFQGAAIVLIRHFLRDHEMSWSEAFGFHNSWKKALKLGLLAGICFLPVGWGLQSLVAWLMQHFNIPVEEQQAVQVLRHTTSWLGSIALGIIAIFLAPVAEEMLFRGILYPAIRQAGYPRIALWSTSIVFAAMHMNMPSFVPLLLLAFLLVFLYERTNNLLSCIVAHSFFNATNFAMFYIYANK